MISHEHKCIYIHIPKCAGTSIERALGHFNNYEGRGGQDHRSMRMIEQPFITKYIFSSIENIYEGLRRLRYKHHRVMNPNNKLIVNKEQFRTYYKFTIIRNPWSRAFSWYKNVMRDEIHKKNYKITRDISFKDFLRRHSGKGMLRPQTYWIKRYDGSIKMDYIAKFETLVEDFQKICSNMKISNIDLPHEIKGKVLDYTEQYDEETINIISDMYKEEIEIFNYSFNCNI